MSKVANPTQPDAQGHFGPYGGRFVPETLMHPLQELEGRFSVRRRTSNSSRNSNTTSASFAADPRRFTSPSG
jgi:tryptophan synthase beta chain